MSIKNIIIGNDHTACDVKFKLKQLLEFKGYNVINIGTDDSYSTHYPYYAFKAANCLLDSLNNSRAIVICGTGIGISIAANKVKSIRCMVCHTPLLAKVAREQFDINMLGLGARVTGFELLESIVNTFLNTPFNTKYIDNKALLDNMLRKTDFSRLQDLEKYFNIVSQH